MIETNNKKWILVADGGNAKIVTHLEKSFQVVYEIQSPLQHTYSKNLATDKDGNFYSNKHHSKGNGADLHDQAETAFINEIGDLLEKEFYLDKFNKLTLIMPSKALGKMRLCLSKSLKSVIKEEIVKDITYLSENELFARLGKLLE